MKRSFYLTLLLMGLSFLFWSPYQVAAQEGGALEISADYQFGDHITFIARLDPSVQVQNASIFIYNAAQTIAYTQPVTFDQNGISEFRFDTRQNILRPFSTILWRYDLTFNDGTTTQSETQSIRYDDDRFNWQTQAANGLRVHWYEGGTQFGLAALNAGLAGLQSIQTFFTIDLSQPVDIYIYADENDLRGTLYLAEDWVAGHADSTAGVAMVMIAPEGNQNILMEQRIPHELMHVLLYRHIGAGYKNIPAWLREGLALLAEVYPNAEYEPFLKDAYARDRMIPIRDLCASFSSNVDSAFLAYAESRSFTNYLRGQYGTGGLLNLASIYASGVGCEQGPERAFGVSLVKLQRDWQMETFSDNSFLDTLGGFAPYIGLLCLVVFVPLLGIIGSMRKKGAHHG